MKVKILCLFGFHTFEYEESILTGKRYKVCRHCGKELSDDMY